MFLRQQLFITTMERCSQIKSFSDTEGLTVQLLEEICSYIKENKLIPVFIFGGRARNR